MKTKSERFFINQIRRKMSEAGNSASNSSCRSGRNLFEQFEDHSDSGDDFEIPHCSDGSGSSSNESFSEGSGRSSSRERSRPEPSGDASRLDQLGWEELNVEPDRPRN